MCFKGDNTQDELIYKFILRGMDQNDREDLRKKNLPRVNSLVLVLCVTRFPTFMSPQITF